jgi:PAS domain S-box-containing protein
MPERPAEGISDNEIAQYWREFFQSALEALPVGVVILNRATYVVSVNEAFERLLGRSRREVGNQKLETALPEALIKEYQILERVAKIFSKEAGPDEFEAALSIDGQDRVLRCLLRPGLTSDNPMRAMPTVVIAFHDVTKERQLQLQVFQSEKMSSIGRIAGGVAHEMNTPLAAVMFNAQLLQTMPLPEEAKPILKMVESSAARCRDIAQTLMGYVRPTRVGARFAGVPLASVLEQVMVLVGAMLAGDGVEVVRDIRAAPVIRGNADELSQIFVNLLANAWDAVAGRPHKRIHLRLYAQGEEAIVEVEDNGEGISAGNLSRLFDPFFTTKAVGKGTGLGLTVCKGIIEKHSGSIQVKSQLGQGSTFTVRLPLMSLGEKP